jgi:hypothetical protein
MLQDLERGRSLEIDALVTAVQELGRLVKVATPTTDAVLALVQERGRQAGLYSNDISPVDGSDEDYRLDGAPTGRGFAGTHNSMPLARMELACRSFRSVLWACVECDCGARRCLMDGVDHHLE